MGVCIQLCRNKRKTHFGVLSVWVAHFFIFTGCFMAVRDNLRVAKANKNDEFYTQLCDVEAELRHYKPYFEGKTVFCNCDDPYESNFFKYFALNFNFLKLKKLIATSYDTSPVAYTQLALFSDQRTPTVKNTCRRAYKIEITEVQDYNGDGAVNIADVEYLLKNGKNTLFLLEGNGDFRSEECVALLKEADIVCTNPPFSLFREYIAQLVENDKKFLIIGNKNALTYKEVFSYVRDNKVWLGYEQPKTFENAKRELTNQMQGLCRWFTNLPTAKRAEKLVMYRHYVPEEYPKYDNYDAINVDKITDIPDNYFGDIGVPITFFDKYNPEQFEIVKFRKGDDEKDLIINGKFPYFRVIIRRRKNED